MKRTAMPARVVPLAPGGPLQRHQEMSRGTGLRPAVVDGAGAPVWQMRQRQTAIAPVSTKRKAENRKRRAMAKTRFPDRNPPCPVPWCPRPADDLHEILTRARGGSITDKKNTIPMCRLHNGELTLEPVWGYLLKFLKHSGLCCKGPGVCAKYADWDEPLRILAEVGVVWLMPDGQITYERPDGAA